MGEIRIVGPGKTRGYPYAVCKRRLVCTSETRGYPYLVCKQRLSLLILRTGYGICFCSHLTYFTTFLFPEKIHPKKEKSTYFCQVDNKYLAWVYGVNRKIYQEGH